MIKVVKNIKLSKNLSLSELVCREGKDEVLYDYRLIEAFQALRDFIGRPMIVNSGYRSPLYNRKVGGSPKSQHVLGRAIDFRINGMAIEDVYQAIRKSGLLGTKIKGLGLYNTFVHIDVRENPHSRGYSFWDMRK